MNISAFLLLLFLAGFVALRKTAAVMIKYDQNSYKQIIQGISILSLTTIIHMLAVNGLFQSLPFMADKIFFQLAFWTLVILGSSLLINGVGVWLPIYRQHRHINADIEQEIKLLDKTDQILLLPLSIENRLRMIMKELHQRYKPQHLKLSVGGNNILSLYCDTNGDVSRIWSNQHEFESDSLLFCQTFSIKDKTTTYGNMIIGSVDQDHVDAGQSKRISAIMRKIAAEMKNAVIDGKVSMYENILSLQYQLAHQPQSSDLKASADSLSSLLKKYVSWDVCMLSVSDSRRLDRCIITDSGQQLLQKNITVPASETTFAAERGESIYIPDITSDFIFPHTPLLARLDMKSVYAVPINLQDNQIGVLTLASSKVNGFSPLALLTIDSIIPILSTKLQPEKKDIILTDTYLNERISELADSLFHAPNFDSAAQRLVDFLCQSYSIDTARVMNVESGSPFLRSCAVAFDKTPATIPTTGVMILDLMPTHQKHFKTTTSTTGTVEQVHVAEAAQVATAKAPFHMIYPLRKSGQIYAFLTLASEQAARLRQTELGSILSVGLAHLNEKHRFDSLLRESNRMMLSIDIEKTSLLPGSERASLGELDETDKTILFPERTEQVYELSE